jgi:cell wall-associated NlpC family hydrolase
MTEKDQRTAVIAEAMTWLRTPYLHRGAVKSAGVDCAYFLIEVYSKVGMIERFDPGYYPMDYMMHNREERYLSFVSKFGRVVTEPQPADVAIYKFGRSFSHGAIVLDWPSVIHSHRREGGVVLGHGNGGELSNREVVFYSLWGN